ncbi:MAG: DUF1622 domain-containing protein [Burkholderiales bacterium]|nr:DUF1622 domain-containing protein [Burkholderiales bacterium]
MEEFLRIVAANLALAIQAVAVLVIAYGSLEAVIGLLPALLRRSGMLEQRKAVWRRFGMWLVLGLEFQLASDIVLSVIAPSWTEIGKLAAIAVIRTFLNYFLQKDLETAKDTGKP